MRVVVTRPKAQARELSRRLEELGHEVVLCPLIEIQPLAEEAVELGGYDWVVVTSANGASELARRAAGRPKRLAAIGPATAEVLREHGWEPQLVPRVATQEGLAAELPRPPGRVLVAAAEGARRYLVDELGADFLPLYRTRPLEPPKPPAGDLVVLASASAARAFGRLPVRIPAVSIGPETTRAARAAGVEVVSEARPHTVDGIVAAVAAAAACCSPRP